MKLKGLDRAESGLVDLVARLAPWLAPLPTAFLIGRATVHYLDWPITIGVVAAAVIESLGLASTSTALMLWDWNRSKRKTDPRAPFSLALALVGAYFVVATGLTVLLDILPQAAHVAPAIFPTLSLTGVTILALRSDHAHRIIAVQSDRTARSSARKVARSRAQVATTPTTQELGDFASKSGATAQLDRARHKANGQARQSKSEAIGVLIAYLDDNPDASLAQAGRVIARSKSTVANYTVELVGAGRLERNGSGWRVLDQAEVI